ncbi:MAG: GFA family protein [Luteimonas sp.]
MKHMGGCHCGGIAFELEADVSEATDCNCSLCRKRGGLLAFFPREALTLKTPEADLGTYGFNQHHIRHHFCPKCGMSPFSEGEHPRTGDAIAAVNVRCLPDVDLASLTIKQVDGASL